MARARRTVSRMEKFVHQALTTTAGGSNTILSFQLDQGEVEAQVKRIMISFGAAGATKLAGFKLGLFQFQPTASSQFDEDETCVLSGAIGNQFVHNDTITMRVPKDWYIGVMIVNYDGATAFDSVMNLQLNYKVLN